MIETTIAPAMRATELVIGFLLILAIVLCFFGLKGLRSVNKKIKDTSVDCACNRRGLGYCEHDCRCYCHVNVIWRNFVWKFINPLIRRRE